MTNTNCLEGIKCPICDNEDEFHIAVNATATVTDDGAVVERGEIDWDANSHTESPDCANHGRLSGFMAEPPAPEALVSPTEPTRAELLRFLTDYVAYFCAGDDSWPARDGLLERARRLLRQAKRRSPA